MVLCWTLYSSVLLYAVTDALKHVGSCAASLHRIAFGSCFNPKEGGSMWKLIESFSPNHLVLLGDQIYVDKEDDFSIEKVPTIIKEQYDLFSSSKEFQGLQKSLDTWSAVYDDHDYGLDNADKFFPPRLSSQRLFWEFASSTLPQNTPEPKTTGVSVASSDPDVIDRNGVYSSKTITLNTTDILEYNGGRPFKYKLILLDSRSNKDKLGTPDGDFLGAMQWVWLTDQLEDPEPDLIIIGSSILVISDDKPVEENWSEFPAARERLLALATAASFTKDVVFLSGDIHRAEVARTECSLQYRDGHSSLTTNFYDFTSSGLGHTFIEKVDPDEESYDRKALLPVVSRGWIPRTLDWLYEATYPALYREKGRADGYSGVHFGLIDIKVDKTRRADPSSSSFYLQMQVIGAYGKPVIQKTVPLRNFMQRPDEFEMSRFCPQCGLVFDSFRGLSLNQSEEISSSSSSSSFEMQDGASANTHISCASGSSTEGCYSGCGGATCLKEANVESTRIPSLAEATGGDVSLECKPQLNMPFLRILLFRAEVATLLLIFVVTPLIAALWLVCASIWYVCMRKEWKRRDRIERAYQAAKKND